MKKIITYLFALIVVVTSLPARAQVGGPFERVLLPVAVRGERPGAFGSRWTTPIAITVAGDRAIYLYGYDPRCSILPCLGTQPIPPGITFYPEAFEPNQGAILLLQQAFADRVQISLRAQDVSRQGQTFGTEVPVVRGRDWFDSAFDLPGVPIAPEFRTTLRIYDSEGVSGRRARIQFYRTDPAVQSPATGEFPRPASDVLLNEITVTLAVAGSPEANGQFAFGYAEIDALQPGVPTPTRLRIRVIPESAGQRLWAYVSVIHNETQSLTVISPSKP